LSAQRLGEGGLIVLGESLPTNRHFDPRFTSVLRLERRRNPTTGELEWLLIKLAPLRAEENDDFAAEVPTIYNDIGTDLTASATLSGRHPGDGHPPLEEIFADELPTVSRSPGQESLSPAYGDLYRALNQDGWDVSLAAKLVGSLAVREISVGEDSAQIIINAWRGFDVIGLSPDGIIERIVRLASGNRRISQRLAEFPETVLALISHPLGVTPQPSFKPKVEDFLERIIDLLGDYEYDREIFPRLRDVYPELLKHGLKKDVVLSFLLEITQHCRLSQNEFLALAQSKFGENPSELQLYELHQTIGLHTTYLNLIAAMTFLRTQGITPENQIQEIVALASEKKHQLAESLIRIENFIDRFKKKRAPTGQ
ncbi:MAG TPA: hypothetical protein DF383_01180, partial [Deltaproteobacteria bacterium]|nr:hypothetical protein [Deltaproteobacteria bacterium]